ncbi:hypothetical protein ILUMI_09167 [Ignelater luminosus]|uniref:Uncharacterized protein n=1 Tax=Ignelater luminosus TaxID=2038154 RepID=A0A8K0D6A0_IGNLU|nr:hypothetical protein ILUMI_09167 [Ignelater luminosus]
MVTRCSPVLQPCRAFYIILPIQRNKEDSYLRFIKLHPGCALRSTQSTSVQKAQGFNKEQVDAYQLGSIQIFEERIGKAKNVLVSLELKEDATPIALKSKAGQELKYLEDQGIIMKTEMSDWASRLIITFKADYKVEMNAQLTPISKIDDIQTKLLYSECFSILDLYKAYLHMTVKLRNFYSE